MNKKRKLLTPGLADQDFVRGDVPLTKQEIRCLTLCKLQLEEGSRVLDIGAGSGGLSIECALLLGGTEKPGRPGEGEVWAVERNEEALALLEANVEKFGVGNLNLVRGEAPAALQDLDSFDRVIIGGSGGNLPAILEETYRLLVPGGVIVLNCILLQTLSESLVQMEKQGFREINFIQASIARARKMGSGTALQPLNPVFIVSAVKGAN